MTPGNPFATFKMRGLTRTDTNPSARSTPSFWLEGLPARAPRPSLERDRDADVCIVGAGYTGLWTAYELIRAQPSLAVVVIEARQAGFGASGRNGGWVFGELAGATSRWVTRAGVAGARAQALAIQASVDDVAAVVAAEGIACDLHRGGVVTVALGPAQRQRLRERHAARRAIGVDEDALLLDGDQARERIAVAGALGARFSPHCARVQPARLVAGLTDAVLAGGVDLYEGCAVRAIEPGCAITTDGRRVRARHVLRATEAYTAGLAGLRRALLPLNSSMIVTEPLDAELWGTIGWRGGETLSDAAHVFVYLQRTADGRIAIGGRGVPYRYGSRTDREGPVPGRTVRELRERLVAMFPALAGVRLAAAWHGVLGVTRAWRPGVGLDPRTGLAWAGGYVGEGVAAANLAGRTLRDLILGRDSELTRLPWVGAPGRGWEPEPLRFLGARGAYALYGAADRRERVSGRPSTGARAADRLLGR